MADTNKESTGQEPSDKKAAAEKKAAAASPESETKPVADLLISVLNDVQERVQTRAAVAAATAAELPLVGKALEAVEQFREIVAQLALSPTIRLTANPTTLSEAGTTLLTWASTAQFVQIVAKTVSTGAEDLIVDDGPASGNIEVEVQETTIFTAITIGGFCGRSTDSVTVVVGTVG